MNSDVAGEVIDLTNTVGNTVYDLQRATAALTNLKRAAAVAARYPGGLAVAGIGLLAASAVIKLKGSGPSQNGPAGSAQSQS